MSNDKLSDLLNLKKRIEQHIAFADTSKELSEALVSIDKLIRKEMSNNAGNGNGQLALSAGEDIIEVGGNVGPGAAIGNAHVTNNADVAGGDIAKRDVIKKQINIYTNQDKPNNSGEPSRKSDMSPHEKDYLMWLRETAGRIPLGRLEIKMSTPGQAAPDIRLSDIYVPLDILRTQRAIQRDDIPVDWVSVPVLSAVITQRQLVILGDPGSGKSTFLNFLTLCLVGERLYPGKGIIDRLNVEQEGRRRAANWKHGALLPIRVSLREFAQFIPKNTRKGTAKLVWAFIEHSLEQHNLGQFSKQMREELSSGTCLVMFDGLDEIVETRQRQVIRDAVTDFSDAYSQCRVIVTCRVLSYTDTSWQLPGGFPTVTLAPLSARSIQVFVDKWYLAIERMGILQQDEAKFKARQLRDATENLSDLAQNPMLLTVMSVVHTYKGNLPRERSRLYDDCVQLLLWDWQRAKQTGAGQWEDGIVQLLDTREERLINGLCEVAYNAHNAQAENNNLAHIPETTVVSTLKNYLGSFTKAEKFCEYVEHRAGLLIGKGSEADGERMFSFPHRGFQEFLAARYIVTNRDFARSVLKLAEAGDIWHEVLLLATGHLVFNHADVYRPLNAINMLCKTEQPTSETGWRLIWWAAEMLAIVGPDVAKQDDLVGKDVLRNLMKHLVSLVTDEHLTPVERAQAAEALGWIGDVRPGVTDIQPDMVPISGGTFEIGLGQERHKVKLNPFLVGRYPVTNAQFKRFSDQGYNSDKYWTKEGLEWRNRAGRLRSYVDDPDWGIANSPVVGVTWYEAVAYANWLAAKCKKPYRLLTEAEWERVATGGERKKYPFGNRANNESINSRETGIGKTTAVGIFKQDQTEEGVFDLAGNVWEWCSSLAKDYPYKASDKRENLSASGARILRGGAYDNTHAQIDTAKRHVVDPYARVQFIGFRLAMDA